jgi:hypothetical protein
MPRETGIAHDLSPARHHGKYLTSDQLAELVSEYKTGSRTEELGAKYDIHRTTVSAILKRTAVIFVFSRSTPMTLLWQWRSIGLDRHWRSSLDDSPATPTQFA